MKKLKAGIIGTGGISRVHLENLALMKDRVEMVSGCDIDQEALSGKAGKYGFKEYNSFVSMLDAEDLDFVLLCTPQMFRKVPIAECVRRKIPVFTEKPPAADLRTAREIESITSRGETPVAVAFLFRYMPVVSKAIELLGERGILLLDIRYLCPMMYPDRRGKEFFYRKELSGGIVMDQAIHFLDLTRYLLKGGIDRVCAFGANVMQEKNPRVTTEESITMSMRSGSGALVSYLHTWTNRQWEIGMEIFAPWARIRIDFTSNTLSGTVDGENVSFAPEKRGNIYYEELAEFVDYLAGGRGRILSPYPDSVKTMELADAVMESVDRGEAVNVSSRG